MNSQGSKANDVASDLQRSFRVVEFATPGMIMRERSFVRPQNHHGFHHHQQIRDSHKRRSLILNSNNRGKPTMEIYRPPGVRADGMQQQNNKLNVHAKEFTMMANKPGDLQTSRSQLSLAQMYGPQAMGGLHHSRSSGSILHQLRLPGDPPPPLMQAGPPQLQAQQNQLFRAHTQIGPIMSSHTNASPRVHFKLAPQQQNMSGGGEKKKSPPLSNGCPNSSMAPKGPRPAQPAFALKRSKSLTSADTLASGMASLGLSVDSADLGVFPADIQENLDKALDDPRQLNARTLMSLVGSIMNRAVESPRYALPAATACIAIATNDPSCTFLDSLINSCQQWYHEREKTLCQMSGGGRPRLMSFVSFLLELYCQSRRASGSQSTSSTSSCPGNTCDLQAACKTLLTLICRCCEDCIRQAVPSPSDTENLFFILTYIGRDLESQLPGELENLLSAVRDAFLNTAATPSIRKTLLQLIELHAARWQLPGYAVLYYYPSSKS